MGHSNEMGVIQHPSHQSVGSGTPALLKPPPPLPARLPVGTAKPKLLDQARQAIRTRHYSCRTEDAYVGWIKRFIFFHNKRHPLEMAEPEVNQFLTPLAVHAHVAASTQNQALAALLFLYDKVLRSPMDGL